MILHLNTYLWMEVDSLEAAQKAWNRYRTVSGIGASDMDRLSGRVYDDQANLVGHIHYNGRIEKIEPK